MEAISQRKVKFSEDFMRDYGFSRTEFYSDVKSGAIPHHRFGKKIVITKEDEEEFLRKTKRA